MSLQGDMMVRQYCGENLGRGDLRVQVVLQGVGTSFANFCGRQIIVSFRLIYGAYPARFGSGQFISAKVEIKCRIEFERKTRGTENLTQVKGPPQRNGLAQPVLCSELYPAFH